MDQNKKDYNNSGVNMDKEVSEPITPLLEMSKRSRLNKRIEKKSKKTLAISILGIIIIFALLIKFGIPLIAGIGTISSTVSNSTKKADISNDSQAFLSTPNLNPTFNATSSAEVSISGNSTTGKEVEVYLNGSSLKKISVKEDGTFTTKITLSDGENIIKAKATDGKKQSDFSDSITILYKNTPPSLSIDSPSDGNTIRVSPVSISGKTDPDTRVTVNDFWAIVDGSGNYSYNLALKNGDNEVKVQALDNAGNKADKSIHINYSP